MTKFSDFVKEDIKKYSNDFNDVQSKTNEDIEELIHKYSEYSQSELMSEFMRETEKRKGEFSDEKLSSIKNILTPYLDDNQQQKLNDLLNMVK
jgi:hypothetical protein